jgi:hypothetical protein
MSEFYQPKETKRERMDGLRRWLSLPILIPLIHQRSSMGGELRHWHQAHAARNDGGCIHDSHAEVLSNDVDQSDGGKRLSNYKTRTVQHKVVAIRTCKVPDDNMLQRPTSTSTSTRFESVSATLWRSTSFVY